LVCLWITGKGLGVKRKRERGPHSSFLELKTKKKKLTGLCTVLNVVGGNGESADIRAEQRKNLYLGGLCGPKGKMPKLL